ncbi:MAG: NAD-dependent epimerase/dehydratase family protein [Bacilli bacterium]|nr:NAD-dependent epimerase/dehydratase family protein [Bacilli bacterium]
MMKCIVTGATGHIGNVLVRNLFEHGYEIKAIVMPNDRVEMIEPFCNIVYGNVLDFDFLKREIKNVDIVFHLAGIVEIGTGKKKLIFQVNVEGTKNILQVCQENKIKRLIYTSSVHAIPELKKGIVQKEVSYFDPKLVKGYYAKSKAMATNIVLNQNDSSLEIVIVHPSGVIGPYDYKSSHGSQVFIDYLRGKLTAYPSHGAYNFVDVRDVADGIRLAAEKGKNKACYILSGHEITVKEWLQELSKLTGRKPVKTKLAYWFILAMSYFAELHYKVLKQKPLFTHYSVMVLQSNCSFSNELAKNELGFKTRDIHETIKDTLGFVENHYLEKKNNQYFLRKLAK